jgi:hypothetical protein
MKKVFVLLTCCFLLFSVSACSKGADKSAEMLPEGKAPVEASGVYYREGDPDDIIEFTVTDENNITKTNSYGPARLVWNDRLNGYITPGDPTDSTIVYKEGKFVYYPDGYDPFVYVKK